MSHQPDIRATPENGLENLTAFKVLTRGARVRCPSCGIGKLFQGLFRMKTHCSECGFRFERPPGYFLGSTYINYGFTAAITTAVYVVLLFGFRVPRETLLPFALGFCLIFPLVFFRLARSLWLSLDCFFDRAGAAEYLPQDGPEESVSEVRN